MRFKPVPEPPERLDELEAAMEAVPPEPDPEADCCGLIREGLGLSERDRAADWLTFLRALELVEERSEGFSRIAIEAEAGDWLARERLAEAFQERVYGAQELLDALEAEDEPLDVEALSDCASRGRPRTRGMDGSGESGDGSGESGDGSGESETDRARVRRVLEWAAMLGLVEHAEGGYRPTGE